MTKLQCPVLNYKHLTHSSRYTNYQFSWSLLKLSFEIEHWHIYNIMMNPILSRSFFFFFLQLSEKCFCPNRRCAELNLFRRTKIKTLLALYTTRKTLTYFIVHIVWKFVQNEKHKEQLTQEKSLDHNTGWRQSKQHILTSFKIPAGMLKEGK